MDRIMSVSTDVYAAVWSRRKPGEDTEDAILRRVLNIKGSTSENVSPSTVVGDGGVLDSRNGVHFPEGFIAFRSYKGRDHTAVARAGRWFREDNGQSYPTLNQLNASIAAGAENIWNGNWKFRDGRGSIRSIAELRKQR